MKTAMQELLEAVNTANEIGSNTFINTTLNLVIDMIEVGIKKEKQQIIDAVTYGNKMEFYDASETAGEQYYETTFNN